MNLYYLFAIENSRFAICTVTSNGRITMNLIYCAIQIISSIGKINIIWPYWVIKIQSEQFNYYANWRQWLGAICYSPNLRRSQLIAHNYCMYIYISGIFSIGMISIIVLKKSTEFVRNIRRAAHKIPSDPPQSLFPPNDTQQK